MPVILFCGILVFMIKRFHKHKIENLIVVPKIITVHYLELDANFSYEDEQHDFWELVYVDKEDIKVLADSREFVLKQGEILFHSPNEFHRLSSHKNKAPNVFIITFECKSEAMSYFSKQHMALPKNLKFYIQNIIREAKSTFDMSKQDPFITKLKLKASPALGGQQLLRLNLEQLLLYLLRERQSDMENYFIPEEQFDNSVVNEVIAQLKSNIYSEFSLGGFCKSMSFSRSKLYAVFCEFTGFGIKEYYNHLKLDEAKRLFRESELSIKEVSDLLNFTSPSYFCKAFKRRAGMTPSQYKKSVITK